MPFDLLFPPTNRPSVGKPEGVAKSGQLVDVFGMFNSSTLQPSCAISCVHACTQEGTTVTKSKRRRPKENSLHFQLISLDGVPLGAEAWTPFELRVI